MHRKRALCSSLQATIKKGIVARHREVIKVSKRVDEKAEDWEFLFWFNILTNDNAGIKIKMNRSIRRFYFNI